MYPKKHPSVKVSVCIPTYNGESYLEETLSSIDNQQLRDIEVLISDDGSTDATWEIAEAFRDRSCFPVQLYRHERSTLAGNWNFCVEQAKGQYIKFLFQDDLIEPDCLQQMVAIADQDENIGMVFSPRKLITGTGADDDKVCQYIFSTCSDLHHGWTNLKPLQPGISLLADPKLIAAAPWNKIGEPSVVLLRRDLLQRIGGFNESLKQLVDVEIWWRVMAHSHVAFIDRELSSFRVHPEQASVSNARSGESGRDTKRFAELALNADYAKHYSAATVASLHGLLNAVPSVKKKKKPEQRRSFVRRLLAKLKYVLRQASFRH